ncbi:MAG: hypothetical protein Q8N55_04760 [bacterium]|nr:hypothetical protein [bacterium]
MKKVKAVPGKVDFKAKLSKHLTQRGKTARQTESKAQEEQERQVKALKKYKEWREKQIPEAQKAVQIIWDWVAQFWKSEFLQELLDFNSKLSADSEYQIGIIRISHIVSFIRPSLYGGDERREQYLFLDFAEKGVVFVQDAWKYGKHHKAEKLENLLTFAEPPTVISAAERIASDEVWQIILEGFEIEMED